MGETFDGILECGRIGTVYYQSKFYNSSNIRIIREGIQHWANPNKSKIIIDNFIIKTIVFLFFSIFERWIECN